MAQTYIGYSPDVEVLGEDEERLTAEILEIMATTNRRAFPACDLKTWKGIK